jgi:hypothetical protein
MLTMKNTAAAFAALLTSASLMTLPSPSIASPAGLGGGSNVGHNTPSHPSAFGRGFAQALVANGIGTSGPGMLTADDRWGPNNTVAFGNQTKGWGPFEVNRQPGTYPSGVGGSPVPIACPCVVAYDPFHKRVNGGVDFKEAKTLAAGVVDETIFDQGGHPPGTMHFNLEAALMSAVWGKNFDPHTSSNQQQVASGHQQDWRAP